MEDTTVSAVKTTTVWRCLDARWIDNDPECDVIALVMQAAGAEFGVVCSGPKGMKSNDFIPAVHAALAALIGAAGGDIEQVGARDASQGDLFDTGGQRAN
jgi:hypothetical protein